MSVFNRIGPVILQSNEIETTQSLVSESENSQLLNRTLSVSELIERFEEKPKKETIHISSETISRQSLHGLKAKFEAPKIYKQVLINNQSRTSISSKIQYAVDFYQSFDKSLNTTDKSTNEKNTLHGVTERAYFLRAKSFYENGYLEEPLEMYNYLIDQNNTKDVYHYEKGMILLEIKNYQEALECFQKTVDLNPQSQTNWSYKGFTEFVMKKFNEASDSYTEAIRLNPAVSSYLYNKALSLSELSKHEEALKYFDQAIVLEKDGSQIANLHFHKSISLLKLGRIEDADANLVKCEQAKLNLNEYKYIRKINDIKKSRIDNEPVTIDNFKILIELSIRIRDFDNAYKFTMQAIFYYPEIITFYFWKSYLQSERDDFEGAFKTFGKAKKKQTDFEHLATFKDLINLNKKIKKKPEIAENRLQKGLKLAALTFFENSIDEYDCAIELDDSDHRFYFHKAISCQKITDFDEADYFFEKAIDLSPNERDYYYHRSLNKAIFRLSYDPESAEFNAAKGNYLLKLKNFKEALQYYQKAISIDKKIGKCYFNLVVISCYLNDIKQAWTYFDLARLYENLTDDRSLINYYYKLIIYCEEIERGINIVETIQKKGSILARTKHYELAILCFQQALEIDGNLEKCIKYSKIAEERILIHLKK